MMAVERRTRVNFQRDVLGQIGSNAALESTGRGAIVRVDVVNPAAARRTLRKLGASALDLFGSHPQARVTPGPGGFAPSATVRQVLSSLGSITGWLSSSTSAVTGSATLAVK
jgi:hypothetical protein